MTERAIMRRGFFRRRTAPYLPDNRVEVLIDGGPFFSTMIDAIGQAERYCFFESYIFVGDATGRRVAEALIDRARAGVEVAFSFDAVGSYTLDRGLISSLVDAGVKVLPFRPVSLLRGRWPWSKRNHRKLLVVDGRVGIVGGMNVSDDYAAPEDGGRGWRDTAVRIEGPAVRQLDEKFRSVWRRHSSVGLSSTPRTPPSFAGGYAVRFVENTGRRDRADIRRDYLKAIAGAQRTIRIVNAYFTPDPLLLRALKRASRRGVTVEIITGGATDVEPVLHAARGLYGGLLKAGVKIYEWHERVLHAKTAVIDGEWTTIGSANLNYRTWLTDLEVNAMILGPEIGGAMDDRFAIDRAKSQRIDLALWRARPAVQRVLSWFFGLFRL